MCIRDRTQAVLEGVAFGLRDSLEVARSLGIKIERTKICGGGAKSPLWKKIIANVMNLKVDVLEVEEGPSMGGAMLAAVGCDAYPDVETIGKKMAHVAVSYTHLSLPCNCLCHGSICGRENSAEI